VFAFWRYSAYSILVGRYSSSLNSLLFLMIQGLFKSTMVSFKRHKETRGVLACFGHTLHLRYSRSVNSLLFLLSWAFLNLLWCCLKGPNRREVQVYVFLRYPIFPLWSLKTVYNSKQYFSFLFSNFFRFSGYFCADFFIWTSTWTLKITPYLVTNNQHHPHFFPRFLPISLVFFGCNLYLEECSRP